MIAVISVLAVVVLCAVVLRQHRVIEKAISEINRLDDELRK